MGGTSFLPQGATAGILRRMLKPVVLVFSPQDVEKDMFTVQMGIVVLFSH